MTEDKKQALVLWLEEVGIDDVALVGGKNASLGEMIRELGGQGVKVPSGFVVTATAYTHFLAATGLDKKILELLTPLDTKDLRQLAKIGKAVRREILAAEFPPDLLAAINERYAKMEERYGKDVDVAVRSSATAEDLPGASFAGEHDTYLGIRGAPDVTRAVRSAMASLFTDRAISYRVDKGFDHMKVALSVTIQHMVRSDLGASGVMFTVDTESGFKDLLIINGSWGLGEMIVQGEVSPDEFFVYKPKLNQNFVPIIDKRLGVKARKMVYSFGRKGIRPVKIIATKGKEKTTFVLNNEEVLTLARWGVIIENHYTAKHGKWTPMDLEWAKDGKTGELFIVQARPETIQAAKDFSKLKEYRLEETGKALVSGVSVGTAVATGKARVILDAKHIGRFQAGEILVTDMTDPDWEPIMKIAAGIVTDKGGRTSHAAIVSRELGIPAVVGTEKATKRIKTGDLVTIDTTGSSGYIYSGALKFSVVEHDMKAVPQVKTKVMVNIATPDIAFEKSFLPVAGVGLAREEFIIASEIGLHPLALLNYATLEKDLREKIDKRMLGWEDPLAFYVDKLAYGIGKIAAAFHPRPIIVRFSDFKTNEYRTLLGGEAYEPAEENPMIGWRGASRYYDPKFREAFALECRAVKQVRAEMGLDNVIPMVPFCRTLGEARQVLEILTREGLRSDAAKTPVYMMCEIPSNVLLAEEFLDLFDGFSIGSNDLTQLTLGLDRDAGVLSGIGNENDPAVKKLISEVIKICRRRGKYIGICGQAPSDYPDFLRFLVREGIESISLNADSVIKMIGEISSEEATLPATTPNA
ncbi:MAG: phosphoenolpyruvate synthase [Patescibacteria group bacterium]